jgi:hypothetical protein
VWGAVGGVPGLVGFRAVNTLDAMVGHRSARLRRFGWASARLDDVVGWPGSRLTAVLVVLAGADPRGAWRVWRMDGAAHPSPNAGPVEASFAGALGVRLGGTLAYGGRVEHRPVLGGGNRAVEVADIERAVRLSGRVSLLALAVAVGGRLAWAVLSPPDLRLGGAPTTRPLPETGLSPNLRLGGGPPPGFAGGTPTGRRLEECPHPDPLGTLPQPSFGWGSLPSLGAGWGSSPWLRRGYPHRPKAGGVPSPQTLPQPGGWVGVLPLASPGVPPPAEGWGSAPTGRRLGECPQVLKRRTG